MASAAYIESLTGGLAPEVRLAFKRAFEYVLNGLLASRALVRRIA